MQCFNTILSRIISIESDTRNKLNMAESAGSPAAVTTANSPQQQQPQQQQQQSQTQTQTQTNASTQPPDISSSQLASPPITGTGTFIID